MTKIIRFKDFLWQRHPLTGATVFCGCLQIIFRELTWKPAVCIFIHRPPSSHPPPSLNGRQRPTKTLDYVPQRKKAEQWLSLVLKIRNKLISYCHWWFHMESWASRPHTVKCWCTCGSGCCLSTCNRAPCAAQISTPPSPPAFYFSGRKEKQVRGRRMRKATPFISARVIDFHVGFQWWRDSEERWTVRVWYHSPFPAVIQTPAHNSDWLGGHSQHWNRGL